MTPFKKVTSNGKTVNCYGFSRTQGVNVFDPANCAFSFGQYKPAPVSCGISIEPLSGEYLTRGLRGEPLGLPDNELLNNTALLFFERPQSIDFVIKVLQDCKKQLEYKIAEAAQEEYRRKFCGQVVNLREWKNAHPETAKRITGRIDRQAKLAADCMTFHNSPTLRTEAVTANEQ